VIREDLLLCETAKRTMIGLSFLVSAVMRCDRDTNAHCHCSDHVRIGSIFVAAGRSAAECR